MLTNRIETMTTRVEVLAKGIARLGLPVAGVTPTERSFKHHPMREKDAAATQKDLETHIKLEQRLYLKSRGLLAGEGEGEEQLLGCVPGAGCESDGSDDQTHGAGYGIPGDPAGLEPYRDAYYEAGYEPATGEADGDGDVTASSSCDSSSSMGSSGFASMSDMTVQHGGEGVPSTSQGPVQRPAVTEEQLQAARGYVQDMLWERPALLKHGDATLQVWLTGWPLSPSFDLFTFFVLICPYYAALLRLVQCYRSGIFDVMLAGEFTAVCAGQVGGAFLCSGSGAGLGRGPAMHFTFRYGADARSTKGILHTPMVRRCGMVALNVQLRTVKGKAERQSSSPVHVSCDSECCLLTGALGS